jgi:hypothetical protein
MDDTRDPYHEAQSADAANFAEHESQSQLKELPVKMIFTTDGKTPAGLDKTKRYVFFVHPETHFEDFGMTPPFPLLVSWIYGNIDNWKVSCTFGASITSEIGNYKLVAYIELPDRDDVHENQKIINLFYPY